MAALSGSAFDQSAMPSHNATFVFHTIMNTGSTSLGSPQAGAPSKTSCPSSDNNLAVRETASTHDGATGVPVGATVVYAMRRRPGEASSSCENGRSGFGALYQACGSGAEI